MSELDRLLRLAKKSDPVPSGTVDRVEARLFTPRTGQGLGWLVVTGAVLAALLAWPRPVPRAPDAPETTTRPQFAAQRYVGTPIPPIAPLGSPAPRSTPLPGTGPSAQRSEPTPVNLAEVTDPPQLDEVWPDPPAAEAPSVPAPGRARVVAYRPRVFRDPSAFEWQALEGESLPAAIQAIVAERDPSALLAALDPMALEAPALLLARGELRAAADRCPEAIADFTRVLSADPADARALAGRAACSP